MVVPPVIRVVVMASIKCKFSKLKKSGQNHSFLVLFRCFGEVSEWSNVRFSKSRAPQGAVSSNLTLSALSTKVS